MAAPYDELVLLGVAQRRANDLAQSFYALDEEIGQALAILAGDLGDGAGDHFWAEFMRDVDRSIGDA